MIESIWIHMRFEILILNLPNHREIEKKTLFCSGKFKTKELISFDFAPENSCFQTFLHCYNRYYYYTKFYDKSIYFRWLFTLYYISSRCLMKKIFLEFCLAQMIHEKVRKKGKKNFLKWYNVLSIQQLIRTADSIWNQPYGLDWLFLITDGTRGQRYIWNKLPFFPSLQF